MSASSVSPSEISELHSPYLVLKDFLRRLSPYIDQNHNRLFQNCLYNVFYLSYDVASGSEITPYNKIVKPLVVYRFSGNIIMSVTTLRT